MNQYFLLTLEDHNNKHQNDADKKVTNTDRLVSETVDQSLQTYDEDNDGYINYGEFYRLTVFFYCNECNVMMKYTHSNIFLTKFKCKISLHLIFLFIGPISD